MPPLVIFATDQPAWAFNNIAVQVSRELAQFYRFQITPFIQLAQGECDILVSLWWGATLRVKANIKCGALVMAVYDGLSWKVDPVSRQQFRLCMRHCHAMAVANQRFADEIKSEFKNEVPQIFVTEDGVDLDLFRVFDPPYKFTAGWTGNSARHTPGGPDDLKGLSLIKEACRIAQVPLNILDGCAGGSWPLSKMPKFYEDVSVILCASSVEGTPNPVLEGMACGRPIISTNVGLVPDLLKEGVNGFSAQRDVNSIANALNKMKVMTRTDLGIMGKEARKAVKNHGWDKRSLVWKDCLTAATAIARAEPGAIQSSSSKPMISVQTQQPAEIQKRQPAQSAEPAFKYKPRPVPTGPPRVLCISDVPGWAFDQNMQDLSFYLKDSFAFDHWYIIDFYEKNYVPDMELYDIVFCVYHRWNIDGLLPWDRTVGSLRASLFTPESTKPVGQEEYDLVNSFRAFHVVTQKNFDELRDHCPNVVYLTNPVDVKRFLPTNVSGEKIIASWNGNGRHQSAAGLDVKGFYSIIQPACATAGVKLEYAEYHTKRLAPEKMPEFYQKANVALCASLYEGASNSTSEAMASGQALITTDCGNHREIQESQLKHFGETGIIIIERTPQAFVRTLQEIKKDPGRVKAMGDLNRIEIAERWSWKAWSERYSKFLRKALSPTT